MTRRKMQAPPLRPEFPESELTPKDSSNRWEIIGNPDFVKYSEELSIWREDTIGILPQIRKEQALASTRGDHAEVEKLEQEYQNILNLLATT